MKPLHTLLIVAILTTGCQKQDPAPQPQQAHSRPTISPEKQARIDAGKDIAILSCDLTPQLGGNYLHLKLENRGNKAISGIYAMGTLKSPGRPVPWAEDTFYIRIPGGLNPGEQGNYSTPAVVPPLQTCEVPKEAVFTARIIDADFLEIDDK